jgi:hypothetical protein
MDHLKSNSPTGAGKQAGACACLGGSARDPAAQRDLDARISAHISCYLTARCVLFIREMLRLSKEVFIRRNSQVLAAHAHTQGGADAVGFGAKHLFPGGGTR